MRAAVAAIWSSTPSAHGSVCTQSVSTCRLMLPDFWSLSRLSTEPSTSTSFPSLVMLKFIMDLLEGSPPSQMRCVRHAQSAHHLRPHMHLPPPPLVRLLTTFFCLHLRHGKPPRLSPTLRRTRPPLSPRPRRLRTALRLPLHRRQA
eukprot:6187511-Pleurochrysis_carterae.AAC.5